MSSQSYNATAYAGFTTQSDNTGLLPQFPLRDASDWIRTKKQRLIFRENKASDPFNGNPKPLYSIIQSNQTRLSYAFGKVTCAECTGGPFLITPLGS